MITSENVKKEELKCITCPFEWLCFYYNRDMCESPRTIDHQIWLRGFIDGYNYINEKSSLRDKITATLELYFPPYMKTYKDRLCLFRNVLITSVETFLKRLQDDSRLLLEMMVIFLFVGNIILIISLLVR